MKISDNGLEIIKDSEALRLNAYLDTKAGRVPTIGWGHTKGVTMGMTCTVAQAEKWLREDVASAESDVHKYVTVPMSQGAFDALVSFVFNIGGPQFSTSTLLRLLNTGDYIGASNEFQKWIYDNKVKQGGLVIRREKERQDFIFYPGFQDDHNF